jgi:hypothetical protein
MNLMAKLLVQVTVIMEFSHVYSERAVGSMELKISAETLHMISNIGLTLLC